MYFIKWMWIPAFESNFLLYLPGVGLAAFVATHFKPTIYILVYKLIYGHQRYIQSYLKSIARKLPYIISIHIHDIPDEILKTKSSGLLEYLLNPDKVRIKIIKDGNRVLTKELSLTRPEKIIFNYIVFRAYINDVYHKYPDWQRIPSIERVFSEELANAEGIVMKALGNYHKYLPGGSRIRQWVSSIRKILTEIGANDLIPCENPSNRGRGRGYTINGKIILLKEL
ncbi:MAG: hypothetical protein QME42_11350 [bacterium]|nr:hypothetical protein [bacterium]